MKKSEDEPKKGAPAYMNTYGDMMTLLLTFFVLLFSMSSIDVAKFRAVIASFDGSIGVLSGAQTIEENTSMLGNGIKQFPQKKNKEDLKQQANKDAQEILDKLKQNLEQYVQDKNLQDKVSIEQNGDEIILRFDDVLLFDTGKADIKPGAIPVLDTLGVRLKEYLEQGYRIRLEGHTDNVPIRTSQFPSNWELSAARAIAVAKFFTDEMSFEVSKISTEGFRDNVPIGDNGTPEGRAMNRRVEIKISKDNRS
ncbi:flagellar motor protein MotB [Cellulosilyticum sp. I15G10I2]|uniref:flagellar motor protein MotB n=1 Tax=Cellulosilyticum sp. I15G10I2 TaxID=1892843 RepID=UPI00085C814E|nr:flagellar motor protein MotB [Cellulosilyticum sp. I15G10I2]